MAASARDPYTQAIFGIRKPKNVFDADSESFNLATKTVSVFNELLDILNVKAGSKCNPEDCAFDMILGCQDGDVDGDSIFIGVMGLLAKHCRPLIDAGMVGRILPPAYSFPIGKGKKQFIRSKREFFEYLMKGFIKDVTVAYKGKEFGKNDLHKLLEQNFEYDTKLEKLANRYCCDPKLMEYIAWKYHGDQKNQTKAYWSKAMKDYPELKVLLEDGLVVIDGELPGFDFINLAFDDAFDRHVKRFKELQSQNDDIYGYTMGDKDKNTSLYDVMHKFRSYMPKGVERYKGLGELEIAEMKEQCMNPDTRMVIVMKFKDYEKDMEKLSVMLSTREAYQQARSDLLMNYRISSEDIDT